MSSTSSSTSANTPASSTATPAPGVLWVTVNIQDHDRKITPQDLEKWYEEHIGIVLDCPGNGGLFLRYLQTDKTVSAYAEPGFAARVTSLETTKDSVARTAWVYLALVKCSDVAWLGSEQFDAMPRTSDTLPKELDGSIGSAFTYLHAGLRAYETVAKGDGKGSGAGRAKYLLSLQVENSEKEDLEKLAEQYSKHDSCNNWIAYTLRDGVLGYFEPGHMPHGLVLIEMSELPKDQHEKGVVRRDVWELTSENGDLSLSL